VESKGIPVAIAVLALLSGGGCGYRFGVLKHEGVETVAVPIFRYSGLEHRRGIEVELSQAVAEEFISRSGLRLVGEEDADAVLEGEIVGFHEGVILEDRLNNVLESSVVVTLNLRLRRRDGEVLVERRRMAERAEFRVVGGEDELDARRRAFNDLAERVVFALEGPW
jgi:hypothetical protein